MKLDKDFFLEKYDEGLSDAAIARLSGVSASVVNQMRWKLKLPPNRMHKISDELFFELYNQGLHDCEIARRSGASEAQIRRRREKFGLKYNPARPEFVEFPKKSFIDYYNQGLDDEEIADIMHRTLKVVQGFRQELKLPPNQTLKREEAIDNQIIELYNQGLHNYEIAEIMDCSLTTIIKRKRKLNLSHPERLQPLDYHLNNEEFQVVLGSLLGDGNLSIHHKGGGGVLRIAHCEKQKEYLERKYLYLKNISYPIRAYHQHDSRLKNPDYTGYMFYTKSLLELRDLKEMWYTPKKSISFDNVSMIDPLGLAIWYMDDGNNQKNGGCFLCTNSFLDSEVDTLRSLLANKFNIAQTTRTKSNMIYIKKKDSLIFFDIVRPYIVPCMEYKLSS